MGYTEADVFADDEVVVRAWTNGATRGVPVLICSGLGAPAQVWPGLYDSSDCGLRVVGFHHRGTGGSGRPLDESATLVGDYADDAARVAQHFDLDRAVVVGWSVGVAVACELAVRQSDLVAGIVAISGVPQAPAGLRGVVESLAQPARTLGLQAARSLPEVLLDVVNSVPANAATVALLRTGGLLSDRVSDDVAVDVLRAYLDHDPSWYLRLAEQASRSPGPAITEVPCPVSFLTGRQDPLTAWQTVAAVAREAGIDATVVPGGHFLPLEHPDLVREQITEMAARTGVS